MKLKKFRIRNYKSIIDSGDCYVEPDLTIFAGKNESGKTSILEALYDFNPDRVISEEAIPIRHPDALPAITMSFIVSPEEMVEYFQNFDDGGIADVAWESKEITITKTYPDDYSLDEETKKFLGLKVDEVEGEEEGEEGEEGEEEEEEEEEYLDALLELLPNFIFFRSFDDILPNEIPFSQLDDNEFVEDLSIVSDLDVSIIKSTNERKKRTHKQELNVKLNNEYREFWVQDLTRIAIDWDSNTLRFWIEEDGENYKPSERSKGKQWHMSFYLKVTARAKEGKANIILIDEPGLFLHAAAQRDVYKKLLESSASSQIIFTTHSPYLLDRNELHRIRLVLKPDTQHQGTIIENKIHARADKETLTPILTAIGLGLNDGIQNIGLEKNVVVEGPSDYYYLQALKTLLDIEDFNFIYGGGAGNMGHVGTILMGWGAKVIYLYDNDKGKSDGSKNLRRRWLVRSELILSIMKKKGSIEDLFSRQDFKKYILRDASAVVTGANSEYIKQNKLEKVLLAKKFITLVHNDSIELTKETMERAQDLFEKIKAAFDNWAF